eukprot:TRINITY_DN2351_c0_g1_i3.p1 TRINITY_DN2351_c0_g1~~TRINITY_DN2351_c0_g1_i3.p1  ORF type:complete len:275 (+),score=35.07 TRINITY_DN2351_c0_g1_i3:56-880(+)
MTSAIPDSAGKAGFDDRWPMPANVAIVPENPQTRAMMTVIRDRRTQTATFRRFADRIVRVCIEYALSFLPTSDIAVTTPTDAEFDGLAFQGRVCGVSIMRAGECMEPALRICCPGVRMGTILIQRDENSADKGPDIRFQYRHLPKDIASRHVLLMDPMLATGGTVHRAIEQLEELGVPLQNIIFVNIISSRTGLHRLARTYPKLRRIVTFEVDPLLDLNHYIIPGLGDFGDRYFGTGKPDSALTRAPSEKAAIEGEKKEDVSRPRWPLPGEEGS